MTAEATCQAIIAGAMSQPGVTAKRMFGADCFLVGGRMFAFLMADSLAVKVPPDDRQRLLAAAYARPFPMGDGRPFGQWLELPLAEPEQLARELDALDQAYGYAQRPATANSDRRRRSQRRVLTT